MDEEYEDIPRDIDYLGNIRRILRDLSGTDTLIYELIQNADDAKEPPPGATVMKFTVTNEELVVYNDGVFTSCEQLTSSTCKWLELNPNSHRCDFHSFRTVASWDKGERPGTTGAFGIGFTAVYQVTDRPEFISHGEHWIVDEMRPAQSRIQGARRKPSDPGTTFKLPWVLELSEFRKAIEKNPITRHTIDRFFHDLKSTIPDAMPFLKRISVIEAVSNSEKLRFERSRDINDPRVLVVRTEEAPSETDKEWLVLDGDFKLRAEELRLIPRSTIKKSRSADVQIAIPKKASSAGFFYATLPTKEQTHLPLIVNAEFFPTSDRKGVRFDESETDGIEGEWNRAAVQAAAKVLAENLEEIADFMGDAEFVRLLVSAADLKGRLERERINPVLGAFWPEIARALPSANVVPKVAGGRATVESVRLWADETELAAASLLTDLDIHLIDPKVRADWFRLRGDTPIRVLNLGDLVHALHSKDLDTPWIPEGRADSLAERSSLEALWALIDFLLKTQGRSTRESEEELRGCAVVPGVDGALWPVAELYRTDPGTQAVLTDLRIQVPFLDSDRLGAESQLAAMVSEVTPVLVLDWVEDVLSSADANVGRSTRLELLKWFFDHESELDDAQCARIARLSIFPTASGARPLAELALPGDFKDELGLARLLDVEGIEEIRPFLDKLGAQRLSFANYCRDHVARAVKDGQLGDNERRQLLEVLATKLSEVKGDAEVRSALQHLELIPCTDGRWRSSSAVYLTTRVCAVVGDNVALAAIPPENYAAHEDLFRWLGAAEEPRPADVVARCQELQLRPGTHDHREVAEAILQYVGAQFDSQPESVKTQYARLQTIHWLPAVNDHRRGHLPSAVYTMFQQSLFASQALFIDVSAGVQQRTARFLNWLGVSSNPKPKQVVDHLLWSATRSEPVGEEMWIYLDHEANDPALDALLHRECLLLAEGNTYVSPDHVYWGRHPFGRWRRQLGPKFAKYQALLDRLGVAQEPVARDAIEVLLEIAVNHNGEQAPLLEHDIQVVQACWGLLSTGLQEETISKRDLEDLAGAEVILDGRSWLRRPVDVFFRDSHSLPERFGPQVQDHLIEMSKDHWQAMAAAGVRNLSDAAKPVTLDFEDDPRSGVVTERLTTYQPLLLRVLSKDDHDAAQKIEAFYQDVRLVRLSHLRIKQTIEINGREEPSDAYLRGALFRPENRQILFVEVDDAQVAWPEVAREVTRALNVDGSHFGEVSFALRAILAAPNFAAALAEIDEDFPALRKSSSGTAEPSSVQGFGKDGPPEGSAENEEVDAEDVTEGDGPPSGPHGLPPGREGEKGPAGPQPSRASSGEAKAKENEGTVQPKGENGGGESNPPSSSGEHSNGSAGVQIRGRTYAVNKSRGDSTSGATERIAKVERAGVEAVLAYEREHGRHPEEMSTNNPGFDIRSEDNEGRVRIIEVKATAGAWGAYGVAISSAQFTEAQKRGGEYWLYVVERALMDPKVYAINDPVSDIEQYFFDDGWKSAAEKVGPIERPIPTLHLPTLQDGVEGAVPFDDRPDGSRRDPSGWVACPDPERDDTWFAVRIRGDSLGLKYRGGVAFVQPINSRDPEDDELVAVLLEGQVDPDTGDELSIRRWHPERDSEGILLELRLFSDSSVEPLTVERREGLKVLGAVDTRWLLRQADLEELGYC